MTVVTELAAYRDDRGNEIRYEGRVERDIKIKFTGRDNLVVVSARAVVGALTVDFDCDNGVLRIGASQGVPAFSASIRIGQDSKVVIGRNVSTTSRVAMSAVEGTSIRVGDDVMFASENQVRTDDGHPIFDVRTGRRVNLSRSIRIGSHVWVGREAVLLGGARVGDGSVIGYRSLVTGRIPNNCVAVGSPARVVRRDIAWERPHLSLIRPYYKPDASTLTRTEAYWNLTEEPGAAPRRGGPVRRLARRLRSALAR